MTENYRKKQHNFTSLAKYSKMQKKKNSHCCYCSCNNQDIPLQSLKHCISQHTKKELNYVTNLKGRYTNFAIILNNI